MERKLILTGFMATGKSVVGSIIARRLGWRLIDTDREIVTRAGKSVARIFAEEGEPDFRALERQVIAQIASDPKPAVISTGGGALVDPANYEALTRTGEIICLAARPEVIAARVRRSREPRPKLLEGSKPLDQRIAELLDARKQAYARASVTVDTSDLVPDQIAEQVLAAFQRLKGNRCATSA